MNKNNFSDIYKSMLETLKSQKTIDLYSKNKQSMIALNNYYRTLLKIK